MEQLNSSGTATARYTQGLGIDEPMEVYEGGKSYYYQADGLGSIVALTKSTGTAANTYFGYNTFGGMPNPSETVSIPFRFTAREFDSETGLYYYRARYYDSFFGRFLSEDPIGLLGGVNLYEYVRNDPAKLVDPLGLAAGTQGTRLPTVPTGEAGCKFVREFRFLNNPQCKGCWYECRGYGAPVVFPQAVENECPSIDSVTGLVQTNEIDPRCGGKPCKDKQPHPSPVPQVKPVGNPSSPLIIVIIDDILEGAAALVTWLLT